MNKRECTKHIALRLITELERGYADINTMVHAKDRERYRQAELDYAAAELRRRHCINGEST